MYERIVDVSDVITTRTQFVRFEEYLETRGEKVSEIEHAPLAAIEKALEKRKSLEHLGYDVSKLNIGNVPADSKYIDLYARVYHSTEDNVVMVFEHQTGPYCRIETDESSITISGPDEQSVEHYRDKIVSKLGEI